MLYEEARVYLDSVSKYGSVLGLDSIKNLLEELGNPQKELTFIPVSYTHLRAHETKASDVYKRQLLYISQVPMERGLFSHICLQS